MLEPLERVWNHLLQHHKADFIAQAEACAKRDRGSDKKVLKRVAAEL
jgi:hypothetical protein